NTLLFSPRLLASRLSLLNPATYITAPPAVRAHAVRSALAFGSLISTVLAAAKLSGASVSLDPTDSDFAKVRIGSTSYDIAGGFVQYGRVATRMAQAFGQGEGVSNRITSAAEPLPQFFRAKLAPTFSLVVDVTAGKDFVGRPVRV